MDLLLRKVAHPQAPENYRVVAVVDDEKIEVGSIGLMTFTSSDVGWVWGIDTVVPLRSHQSVLAYSASTHQSEGRGADRQDCMKKFRAAWENHCAQAGWLDEFLAMKRKRQPRPIRNS